jgi:hypothetical protein
MLPGTVLPTRGTGCIVLCGCTLRMLGMRQSGVQASRGRGYPVDPSRVRHGGGGGWLRTSPFAFSFCAEHKIQYRRELEPHISPPLSGVCQRSPSNSTVDPGSTPFKPQEAWGQEQKAATITWKSWRRWTGLFIINFRESCQGPRPRE